MDTARTVDPTERQLLERLAGGGEGVAAQRARAILAWFANRSLEQAAAATGLRVAQVRYWVTLFERSGPAIFPPTADRAPAEGVPAAPAAVRRAPGGPRLRGTDPVPGALARILVFQFRKLKKLERAAFGGDEEAIHDMRVAIRRVRGALRIARPFFPRKPLRRLRARLRETAQVLGSVRDLDVIVLHAQAFAGGQTGEGHTLDGWIDELNRRRADGRRALSEHLAGKRYGRLRAELQDVLGSRRASPGEDSRPAGEPGPPRIVDLLPGAIWTQYGAVRAYETVAESTTVSLHTLRIEIKRLRYLLEFFRTPLGARVVPAIEAAVSAQDRLGRFTDVCVAAELLQAWLHTLGPAQPADARSAAAYLARLYEEIQTNLAQGPELWKELADPAFRHRLARLLERL
jgi:CHAD domain-containing protein